MFFIQVISVEPVEGYIQPGKSVACKLTFCSASLSCNYKFDQTCKVSPSGNICKMAIQPLGEWGSQLGYMHTYCMQQGDSPGDKVSTSLFSSPLSLTNLPPCSLP